LTRDEKLLAFADKHSVTLERCGEVGFGRPAVGFIKDGGWLSYNPRISEDPWNLIWDQDDRLNAPEGVDSYHKGDYVAVLCYGEEYQTGLDQLEKWVDHWLAQGDVEIVEYETQAKGLQAFFSGVTSKAIRFV
jgi:hypothetical protein